MSLVRVLEEPDLFISMTMNHNWAKVTGELTSEQTVYDRLDILCRFFGIKF